MRILGSIHIVCLCLLLVLQSASASNSVTDIDLSGKEWVVSNKNGSIRIPATVPGVVHVDLLNSGIIGDPYYRFNDVLYRWVSVDEWTFKCSFDVPSNLLTGHSAQMVLYGLQTVASVYLNGHLLVAGDNMFHEHYVTIPTSLLVAQGNVLIVAFQSTPTYAADQKAAYPYTVPLNPEYIAYQGYENRQYVRTSQASFGWDWGVAYPSVGMYRPLKLFFFAQARIQRSMVFSYALNSKSLDDWMIVARTTVDVSCSSNKPVSGHVQLSALKVSNSTSFIVDCTSSQDGSSSVEVTAYLRVSGNVPLWWPVGYGSPALFDVTLNLHVENSFSPVDTLSKRTGLKHVELDTSAAPGGSLFRFVVNNVPVFARGANYVPADAFQSPQRINATFLSDILDAAVQANMNMIRIWGGGIFEDDALYDGADERGIMVWEEFKFACALVPRSPAFLESIRREVNDQLTRLAHHASIVVYGGNNENQLTLDWTVDAQDNKKLYDTDYNVLYADVLVPLVFSLDHSRPFWPSSPSNGFLVNDPENNFVVLAYGNGNNASQGDVHFYTYGSDCTDVSIFPQPRFASEFGFQSYPSVESWAEVSQPADLYLFSPLMDHRQHHPDGNQQLVTAISVLFPFQNDTAFASFVYLSQLLQGICMRSESEHYRRLRGDPNIQTAGTLYWQLNNNWQAPSWSTLEYGNSWKLAHYFARRFYAPVLVSPVVRWTKAVAPQPTVAHLRHAATTSRQASRDVTVDSVFDVWVVNDGMSDLTEASLSIVTYSWLGKKLHNFTMPLSTISSGTSRMVWSKDTLAALLDFGCLIGVQCFSEVYLSTAKDGLVSRNSQLFASPKLLAGELSAPKLSAVVQSCLNSRECIVMVRNEPSSGVALWPALRHDGLRGWLSDNVMPTLLPGESAEVTFFSAQDINKSSLQAALSVQSLWDHL